MSSETDALAQTQTSPGAARRRNTGGHAQGCMAHARRKFLDLHAANQSQITGFALEQFVQIYDVERKVKALGTEQRQSQADPGCPAQVDDAATVPDGSATAQTLNCNLRRWDALTHFADDG